MLTLQQVFDELHDDARPDSILTALEGLLVEAERRLRQIEAGVRCTNTEGCACHGCQLAELRAESAAAEARSRYLSETIWKLQSDLAYMAHFSVASMSSAQFQTTRR